MWKLLFEAGYSKEKEKIRVICACHDGVDGCHYGRDKHTRRKKIWHGLFYCLHYRSMKHIGGKE